MQWGKEKMNYSEIFSKEESKMAKNIRRNAQHPWP
jgi:hypothetical protein